MTTLFERNENHVTGFLKLTDFCLFEFSKGTIASTETNDTSAESSSSQL